MEKILKLPLADRTNIKDWDFANLVLTASERAEIAEDFFGKYIPENAKNAIVVVDGRIVQNTLEEGISAKSTADISLREDNGLIGLSYEKRNSALSVAAAKNTVPSEPLYIVYIAANQSLLHHSEILLEEGAELDIVETFLSLKGFNCIVASKVDLKPNSKLSSSVINRLGYNATVYFHRTTELLADAAFAGTNFIINDSNMVFEDFTYMLGKGAEASVSTVAIASGEQKQNVTVRIENMAPYCKGEIVNYGITVDSAHLAFNGIGKIHKGQNGGDNQQETRMLNLSKKAEAIANPFLLIDEGDITAGHAASIGRLNDEQVYYLMSRGMSRQESEKMIAQGFLAPFVDNIQDEGLKEQLLQSIEEKLG